MNEALSTGAISVSCDLPRFSVPSLVFFKFQGRYIIGIYVRSAITVS